MRSCFSSFWNARELVNWLIFLQIRLWLACQWLVWPARRPSKGCRGGTEADVRTFGVAVPVASAA